MCEWGASVPVRLNTPLEVSGRTVIDVDACIAPLVQALNDGGIHTIGSCCGHGRADGSILLADGREILVRSSAETVAT